MAQEQSASSFRDMLDIIFADRNKSYGAYHLRRTYTQYLGRALGLGLLLIAFLFALPAILSAVSEAFKEKEKPIEVIAELGPPPDIDPNNPPPPPPPPPPTPPPPTRTTVAFVPPVIKKDEEVAEEEPPEVEKILETKADVGTEDKQGNDEAPPTIEENPEELKVVEEPKPVVEDKEYQLFDVQKQPTFPGGEAELQKFLAANIKYPALARENNIQGSAVLSFVVGKDGSINDITILRDPGGGCGKEAMRVVSTMPKWIPGEANGHAVKVKFTLPVRFRLE